ncbi:G-protein beta WD-40 repeat [Phytophthora cactorum]|nr:G-protein beta WD-40 repeat [Phytophthora cactorum]
MVLTDKQRQDLHQAMLDYLVGMGERFADTAAAFEKEADVTKSSDGKHAGLLEKKWTSVIRLQRKVMELETKLAQLEENAKLGGVLSRRDVLGARQRTEFLPRAPAKFSLTGHRSPITCVAFHPVFSVLVSGSEDASVKVWDFETGEYERTLKGHTNPVQAVAFNGSGSLLASTSTDLSIKIWDFSSDGDYECLRTLRGHDHNVCGIVFGPISRATDCYCVNTLNAGHTDWVRDVAVSDDGLYLASCGNDRSILFWDLQHMRVLQSIREHEHVVESVVFAKTGQEQVIEKIHSKKLAATGALAPANGSVSPKSNNHEMTASSAGEPTGAVAVASVPTVRRMKFLLSGSRDRTVRLWEAFSGMQLMMFASHENWVREVRFHPSGKYALSAGEDKTIRVFDVDTGRCVRTLDEAHSHFVTCLDVHPSLPLIISGGIDKIINVWECV